MRLTDISEHLKFSRKANRAEQQIQIAVVQLVEVDLQRGWFFFHVPNGGARTRAEAGIFRAMGVKAGVADLIFLSPRGEVYCLEMKRPGGRQEASQVAFEGWCGEAGVPYRIAESVDQAIDVLTEWGALKGRVRVVL